MKFRLPDPPDIKGALEARKDKRAARKNKRFEAHVAHITDWHEKFAWKPLRLTNDDSNGSHWAWGEKVTQKAKLKNIKRIGGLIDKMVTEETWTRYTSKEYFKKKLTGEIGDTQSGDFTNMTHDGTDTFVEPGTVSMQAIGRAARASKPDPKIWIVE